MNLWIVAGVVLLMYPLVTVGDVWLYRRGSKLVKITGGGNPWVIFLYQNALEMGLFLGGVALGTILSGAPR